MRRIFLIFLLSFSAVLPCSVAEAARFEGVVIDNYGRGVSLKLRLKHSGKTAVSDSKGNFTFEDAAPDDIIVFRYAHEKAEVPIAARKSAKIVLIAPESPAEMDAKELVDLGMTSVPKEDYTGSAYRITAEDIERGNYARLSDVMRVRCAGTEIEPDGKVLIRGTNSINFVAHALILCDGAEIDSVNAVNVHDVESVEIIKDGTLYGFRGVNGVVSIRTKSGVNKNNE